jgi:hypothetical protein
MAPMRQLLHHLRPDIFLHQMFVISLFSPDMALQRLEEKLEPSKTRKAMSKFGIRALKWLFTSKQVEKIVTNMDSVTAKDL